MPRLTVSQLKKKQLKVKKSNSYQIDNSQVHPNIKIDETVRLAAKGYRDSHNL